MSSVCPAPCPLGSCRSYTRPQVSFPSWPYAPSQGAGMSRPPPLGASAPVEGRGSAEDHSLCSLASALGGLPGWRRSALGPRGGYLSSSSLPWAVGCATCVVRRPLVGPLNSVMLLCGPLRARLAVGVHLGGQVWPQGAPALCQVGLLLSFFVPVCAPCPRGAFSAPAERSGGVGALPDSAYRRGPLGPAGRRVGAVGSPTPVDRGSHHVRGARAPTAPPPCALLHFLRTPLRPCS